jgi:hypothetical protein
VSAVRADDDVSLDRLCPASRGGPVYRPAAAFSLFMGFGYDQKGRSVRWAAELGRCVASSWGSVVTRFGAAVFPVGVLLVAALAAYPVFATINASHKSWWADWPIFAIIWLSCPVGTAWLLFARKSQH